MRFQKNKKKLRFLSVLIASLISVTPVQYGIYPQVAYAQESEIFKVKYKTENAVTQFNDPNEFVKFVENEKKMKAQMKKEAIEKREEMIQELVIIQQKQIEEINKREQEKKAEEERIRRGDGVYTLTAYCACIECCGKDNGITASGVKAKQGVTVANGKFEFGTKIYIEGVGERIVQDRGVGANSIDVYFRNHSEAKKFGMKTRYVKVLT